MLIENKILHKGNQQFEQDQKFYIEMPSLDNFREVGSFLGFCLNFLCGLSTNLARPPHSPRQT